MPPKRRQTTAAKDQENAAKKTTLRSDVTWEWQNEDGDWKAFTSAHANQLAGEFEKGAESTTLSLSRTQKYEVNFKQMHQANKSTGWKRSVRCKTSKSSWSDDWEWEDESGTWNSYSASLGRLFEAASVSGLQSVQFTAAGRQYLFHPKLMEQENIETGVKRNVRKHDPEKFKGWEWLDENGQWNLYAPSLCRQLDAAFASDSKSDVAIEAAGRSYTVHLATMEQENDSTGVKRKIRKAGVSGSQPAVVKKPAKKEEDESTPVAAAAATQVKKVEFQGKAPIDSEFPKGKKVHVYFDSSDVWDAMLNQTNVKNNNNKFYVLQLLEDDKTKREYQVWFRWGRVGYKGQSSLINCGADLDQAKTTFKKKFLEKTKNNWEDRGRFVKVPGKYDLVEIDYEAEEETEKAVAEDEPDSAAPAAVEIPKSKLDKRVQELIELICDIQAMEEVVREMKYDVIKAPLGKLTKGQIKAGFSALKKIESLIISHKLGDELREACDEFYTRIPHAFGMNRPPLIKSRDMVKAKASLLETLGDIEIAVKMLQTTGSKAENPIDSHYAALDCDLVPVESTTDEYAMIVKAIKSTHGRTHSSYALDVMEIFEAKKEDEWTQFKDVGNKFLLWHGSRITNWVGILSQGLRIAPPEAPSTGYMFGKGVYFADICSKSANYCYTSRSQNVGFLLLCEVSLGTSNDLLSADSHADRLPKGKHSVKGQGQIAPSKTEALPDGSLLHLGPSRDTGVHNPNGYTLNYNEFIVYDTKQVRMRYLVKVKFNYK
ncbi:poly [ADP-ribose] polymerase 2-like [Oscarella lobularis]|uniref:poly [ADP-ribose] polymerase 2-like n=1 Tax=Oscarella lobularis TaxID=121494 RepID=UPI0033142C4A